MSVSPDWQQMAVDFEQDAHEQRRKVAALYEGINGALAQIHNKTAMILHLENALLAIQDSPKGEQSGAGNASPNSGGLGVATPELSDDTRGPAETTQTAYQEFGSCEKCGDWTNQYTAGLGPKRWFCWPHRWETPNREYVLLTSEIKPLPAQAPTAFAVATTGPNSPQEIYAAAQAPTAPEDQQPGCPDCAPCTPEALARAVSPADTDEVEEICKWLDAYPSHFDGNHHVYPRPYELAKEIRGKRASATDGLSVQASENVEKALSHVSRPERKPTNG